jgi:hypothetical protein
VVSCPDLVPGDTNGAEQVFVRDRVTGTTELEASEAEVDQVQPGPARSAA